MRDYLSASTENFAVLTDYAAMEAFKGEPQVIFRSMEMLAERPHQVIILKGTQDACGLSPFDAIRPDSLIDLDQTCGFPAFCLHLAQAQRGDRFLQTQLADSGREAAAHMDRVLADMPQLNLGIEQIAATYSSQELKILRRREPFTPRMADKLMHQVMLLAAELFSAHPRVSQIPIGPEVRDTFIFRFAMSAYALALQAIESGAAGRAMPQKLRTIMWMSTLRRSLVSSTALCLRTKRPKGSTRSPRFCFARSLRCRGLGDGDSSKEGHVGGMLSPWLASRSPAHPLLRGHPATPRE